MRLAQEMLLIVRWSMTAQPWTVKLRGGPDGDVGGNMLKILHREYGSMVRVVGMADGSGCAEDPQGLPMAELLRLFDAGLPRRASDGGAGGLELPAGGGAKPSRPIEPSRGTNAPSRARAAAPRHTRTSPPVASSTCMQGGGAW